MKVYCVLDRILRIIAYLFNHDNVSAEFLANKLNTTPRTVNRDVLRISSFGIPIFYSPGKYGGYYIFPCYMKWNSNVRLNEQEMVMWTLKQIDKNFPTVKMEDIVKKYNEIAEEEGGHKAFSENCTGDIELEFDDINDILNEAVIKKRYITFEYIYANGVVKRERVEPLDVRYKWYSWMLMAYVEKTDEYKVFKVSKIKNIQIDDKVSDRNHKDSEKIKDNWEKEYNRKCINVELRFPKNEILFIKEYFPDCHIYRYNKDLLRTCVKIPPYDKQWQGLFISNGDKVKIVSPASYRKKLVEMANGFLNKHKR